MAVSSENETALMQKLADAFEDAGLYSPSRELVEGVYIDAIEPLAEQLQDALAELERLRAKDLDARKAYEQGFNEGQRGD